MLTGLIIVVVIFLALVAVAVYKRDMVSKMFSLHVDDQANLFQAQLEQTADKVVARLEEQIAHLEVLLEEADHKIALLEHKIQTADEVVNRAVQLPLSEIKSWESGPKKEEDQDTDELPDLDLAANNTLSPKPETINNDKKRLIMAMTDQGYSITEIAKATGLGKGEIMLLLQLNKR